MFSVNENNMIYPLRTAKRDPQNTIDLFLYEEDGKCHYSLSKRLSRLFRSQITSRTNGTIHICKKCFTHFSKGELFQKHIEYCSRTRSDFERHLTIKNCDKTFLKIILRLKNC